MTGEQAEQVLSDTYQELLTLGLPPTEVKEGLQPVGEMKVRHGFIRDSYISYKTPAGDAIALAVLQKSPTTEPYLVLRRRRTEGRKMPEVSVDRIPIEHIALATRSFLALAELIGRAGTTWRREFPPRD